MRTRWITRLAANALLTGLGGALALVAAEGIVRRFIPQHFPLSVALRGLHRADPELGYVMVPQFAKRVRTPEFKAEVRINALGLRDDEIRTRAPQTVRLLAIGDSFTLGVHAGDRSACFVEQLETRLRAVFAARSRGSEAAWTDAELINAGVEGYGTVQEVALLERLAPQLRPDGVILAFYLGNDFTDNSGLTRMTVVDGYQMLETSAAGFRREFLPRHRRLRLWLHAHSELYLLLKARLVHPVRQALPAARATAPAPVKPFDYYVYDKGFADLLRAAPSPPAQRGIEQTAAAFARLRAYCDAHAAPALVVAIPAEAQVDPAARSRWIARFGLDAAALDFERPNRQLAQLAAAAGLPLVDLTPVIAAAIRRGERPYVANDPHWNARGHAIAAAALLQPILAQWGVPAQPLVGTR